MEETTNSVIPQEQHTPDDGHDHNAVDHNFVPSKKSEVGQKIEKIAKELKVNLPDEDGPLVIKFITLLTLVGGLSLLGGAMANLFETSGANFGIYILRIISGLAFLVITYGLYKKQRWASWLFALVVVVAFFFNWAFAIVPALVVIYLFLEQDYFEPSFIDRWIESKRSDVQSE